MELLKILRKQGGLGLIVCWLAAAALYSAKDDLQQQVRVSLRDAVSPGARGWVSLRDRCRSTQASLSGWVQAAGDTKSKPTDPEHKAGRKPTDSHRLRQLELTIAELKEELAKHKSGLASPFLGAQTPPLVVPEIVEATVIGRSKAESEALAERLIDQGSASGLAVNDLVVEPVLLDDFDEKNRTALIDQGEGSLVSRDSPVLAGSAVIGRVRQVGAHTSTVQLVTDPEFRVAAQVIRMTEDGPVFGAEGLWQGTGSNDAELGLISTTQPVSVGDRVYSTERVAGTSIPMFLGTITAATFEPGAAHWSITVAPAINEFPERVDVLRINLNSERLGESRSMTSTTE